MTAGLEGIAGTCIVDGRGARRARRGHPWIYRDNVLSAESSGAGIARVVTREGEFLCWAAWSPASRIALRRVSRRPDAPDGAFWRSRLAAALARRGPVARADEGCVRLVHADGDGFPGFVVDRYAAHLVIQVTTAWADGAAAGLVSELVEMTGCTSVLARNDASARELEQLPRGIVQMVGTTPPEIEVREAGGPRVVDPWRGQKTGFYLDQQASHRRASGWLGGRVLDLFTGEGGFALPLARAGARVTAVDQSRPLLERAERSAALAPPPIEIEWIDGEAFEYLTALDREGAQFDSVVLDPPPFARRRDEVAGAIRGYRDLHRRAARLLAPGGRLLTFSCSYNLSADEFENTLREAAEEASAEFVVIERLGAAPDHPERLDLPESRYLKGLLIERVGD